MDLLIVNKSLLCRYLWSDINIFFTELFIRETCFIKQAIYGAHIGFTMSIYPSVRASFRFDIGWDILIFHTNIGIDVAKWCACLGTFDKIQQSEKEFEIRGFKAKSRKYRGIFEERNPEK